jgi:hypothetical protein
MKKNLAIKLTAALLLLAMLVSCFAACGEPAPQTNNGGTTDNGGTNNGGEQTQLTGEEAKYLPAEKNFANYPFLMRAPKQEVFGTVHYVEAEGKDDVIFGFDSGRNFFSILINQG